MVSSAAIGISACIPARTGIADHWISELTSGFPSGCFLRSGEFAIGFRVPNDSLDANLAAANQSFTSEASSHDVETKLFRGNPNCKSANQAFAAASRPLRIVIAAATEAA